MIGGLANLALRLAVIGGVVAGLVWVYRRFVASGDIDQLMGGGALGEAPVPPQDIHDLLPILACPNCKSPLVLNATETELICETCQVAYQIEDGIPVLLPDSGRPLNQPPSG